MSKAEDGNLPAAYIDHLPNLISEEGFPNAPIWALNHAGELTYIAVLGLSPDQVIDVVHDKILADLQYKELVFAIDHFTKPGQGTKYADVLTVYWWYGPHENETAGWRFGVINYKPGEPPVIEPIDWDNEFWNDIMWRGMKARYDKMARMADIIKKKLVETGGVEAMVAMLREKGAVQDQIDAFLRAVETHTKH